MPCECCVFFLAFINERCAGCDGCERDARGGGGGGGQGGAPVRAHTQVGTLFHPEIKEIAPLFSVVNSQ